MFSSFSRQLSGYGFARVRRNGPDKGTFYHEMFLRGQSDLCNKIQRIRKNNVFTPPQAEPDFYGMKPIVEEKSKSSSLPIVTVEKQEQNQQQNPSSESADASSRVDFHDNNNTGYSNNVAIDNCVATAQPQRLEHRLNNSSAPATAALFNRSTGGLLEPNNIVIPQRLEHRRNNSNAPATAALFNRSTGGLLEPNTLVMQDDSLFQRIGIGNRMGIGMMDNMLLQQQQQQNSILLQHQQQQQQQQNSSSHGSPHKILKPTGTLGQQHQWDHYSNSATATNFVVGVGNSSNGNSTADLVQGVALRGYSNPVVGSGTGQTIYHLKH